MKYCTVPPLLILTALTSIWVVYVTAVDVKGLKPIDSGRNVEDDGTRNVTNNVKLKFESNNGTAKFKAVEKSIKQAIGNVVKSVLRYAMENPESAMLNITPMCQRHLMKTLMGFKNMELWAFQMLDAFGKLPNGILGGTAFALGDYDSCLRVDVPSSFKGQYCLLGVIPSKEDMQQLGDLALKSMEDELVKKMFANALHRIDTVHVIEVFDLTSMFRTSVCLPSTCSVHDVNTLGTKLLDGIGLKGWTPSISTCDVKTPLKFDTVQIAMLCILGFVALLVVIGTVIDLYLEHKREDESYKIDSGLAVKVFLCFSAYSNTKQLTREARGSVGVFNSLKVFGVMWVIMSHSYTVAAGTRSISSGLNARNFLKDVHFQAIINGTYGIELFFFMSAVLLMYTGLKYPKKSIFELLLRRLWRMTPPFMFVIAFTILIPQMGSGPLWKESMKYYIETCRTQWWTNLLYLNNYIEPEKMCLMWLWYIPADMHLYIGGLLILWLVRKFPKHRTFIFVVTIVATIVLLTLNNIYYNISANLIIAIAENPENILTYQVMGQIGSHVHMISTSIGLAVGYLMFTKPKLQIPGKVRVFGWTVGWVLVLTVLFSGYEWSQGRNFPSIGVSVLYTVGCRIIWPAAIGWMTLAMSTKRSDASKKLSNTTGSRNVGLTVPLSKLGYMAFLTHSLVLFLYYSSAKVLVQTDHRTIFFIFLGATVTTYMMSYVFSLFFEAPFIALDKLLFPESRKKELPPVNLDVKQKESNGIFPTDLPKIGENHVFSTQDEKPGAEDHTIINEKENHLPMESVKSVI